MGFSGKGDDRKKRLYYAYLPLKDEMLFFAAQNYS